MAFADSLSGDRVDRAWRRPCADSPSATFAQAIYHKIPDEFGGEYSRTVAAAIFVAILFVATMRVQKLYDPNRLMVWDDQARSVLAAWCGAFLILLSGVFSWGMSRDLSRGDIILFGAIGIVALLGHRAGGGSRCPGRWKAGPCVAAPSSA